MISCINKKHFRKWMGTGIVAVGICCVFIWTLFYYDSYKKSVDDLIDKEVIIIKDLDEEVKGSDKN